MPNDLERDFVCATIAVMGRLTPTVALLVLASVSAGAADDPLALARALYNQRQFQAAVSAAEQARLTPARALVRSSDAELSR
jgi:hypothetical protein